MSESFYGTFNGKNLLSLCLVNETLLPNQLEGLGDGHERIRDIFKSDLISLSISPSDHHANERCGDDLLFKGLD